MPIIYKRTILCETLRSLRLCVEKIKFVFRGRIKKIVLILALLTLSVSAQTIRPQHWLDEDLRFYWNRNSAWDLSSLERPFTAHELRAVFDSTATTKEPGLQLLRKMPSANNSEKALGWLLFDNAWRHDSRHSWFHAVQRATLGAQLSPKWQLYTTFYVDNKLDEDSTYLGKRQSGVAAFMEQAFLQFQHKGFHAKFGRDYLVWGPGLDASLHLSAASRPMDHLYLSWKNRWIKLSFFTGVLDKTNFPVDDVPSVQNRYLSGHRLEVRPWTYLRVGLSETALFGGPDAGADFTFTNPVLYYTGVQHNGPQTANVMASLDVDYMPMKNVRMYGSYLLDDMQFENSEEDDKEPPQYGVLAGFNWADPFNLFGVDVFSEYTKITNRTYNGQGGPWERHVHRHDPIGHFLGNDFDRTLFGLRYRPQPNLRCALIYEYRRRGEGRIDDVFTTPWRLPGPYSEPFPTGVVEVSNNYKFTARWQPFTWLFGDFFLSYWDVKNVDNKLHVNDAYWDVWLRVSFELLGTRSIR